jgi:hypothetical protein
LLNYDTIYTERYMGMPDDNAKPTPDIAHAARNLAGRLMIAHNLEER